MVSEEVLLAVKHASGFLGAFFSILSAVPQVYALSKTGDASSFSPLFVTLLMLGSLMWMVFNFLSNSVYSFISSTVWFLFSVFVLYKIQKIRERRSRVKR